MAEIDLPGFEVGAIVERLANIKELIEKLDHTITSTHDKFVAKEEFLEFKTTRDREIARLHESVKELAGSIKAEADARRAEAETRRAEESARENTRRIPWTAVGSFIVAGSALLITLIQTLGG